MAAPEIFRRAMWSSWGCIEAEPHRIAYPTGKRAAVAAMEAARREGEKALAVGCGRSYGQTNVNPDGVLIAMTGLDRLIAFNPETLTLRADAGVTLFDLIAFAAPRGLFLPTTPGTRFVTLGGAIANDVHGKNHHRAGTFGAHVSKIGLARSDAGGVEASPDENPELFRATIGGLGLTGVILWADLTLSRVPSTRIEQETLAFGSLDEFFDIARESEVGFEHTVAWIDCLGRGADGKTGRGIFSRGNWAADGASAVIARRRGPTLPFDAPSFALSRFTIGSFNAAYYWRNSARAGASVVDYDRFFYPLDAIGHWNRLYGARGFYQYQSVVPFAAAADATRAMLDAIAKAGEGSFLAVLKTFGDRPSPGMMSFPAAGATLALDFPNRGVRTLQLFDRLDAIVAAAGGRLYPAKDGRMPRAMFRAGYPMLEKFAEYVDPALSSKFWKRMNAA